MTDTQVEACIKLTPLFKTQYEEMYDFFKSYSKIKFSDLMLWHNLQKISPEKWSRFSSIVARRNELFNDGKIEKVGRIKNFQSGVFNSLWRLKVEA